MSAKGFILSTFSFEQATEAWQPPLASLLALNISIQYLCVLLLKFWVYFKFLIKLVKPMSKEVASRFLGVCVL